MTDIIAQLTKLISDQPRSEGGYGWNYLKLA